MTVSNSTKKDLIEWGISKNNISVIHNGVRIPENFKSLKKQKEPTLMFLGALSRDKGIEEALKAFSIVFNKNRSWNFWVVGKGKREYLEKLKQISRDLGIDKRTTFFGFVSEMEKYKLLSRTHLLVNTSVREGWGLVVIEAAAMKVPTVGFNSPGLRDSIKDGITGVLCEQNNIDKLAEVIEKILKDTYLLRRLSANAYTWSKKFDWNQSAKKSLQLIKQLTS